jgi:hypothetical protein
MVGRYKLERVIGMSKDEDAWVDALDLSSDAATEFKRLAAAMNLSPADVLRKMVVRVIGFDSELGAHGLSATETWVRASKAVDQAAGHAIGALPLNIRPTTFMWPPDKPFPWTAEECRAAVIGYEVKWPGDFDDFLNLLRGKWEFAEGYVVLYQP